MRVHLFPSRTQKLSSCTPTILGGRLPGKIDNANTKPHNSGCEVFLYTKREQDGRSTCFRLRCPTEPSSDEADLASADRGPCLPPRLIRHRRRSGAQPSRTQKLSSSAPTILGGRLPGKIGNANIKPHNLGCEVFLAYLEFCGIIILYIYAPEYRDAFWKKVTE